MPTRAWRALALAGVLALGVVAYRFVDDLLAGDPASVQVDVGVTAEACPDTANPDNGCIYLGTLSDLGEGRFAALGAAALNGQELFWQRVNDQGGVGGLFDVSVGGHVRDTDHDPDAHVAGYRAIVDEVAALTQTLGTQPTLAIAQRMEDDAVVGAALSWWSGWELADHDAVLQTGSNSCVDAMNGVEWVHAEHGADSLVAVAFPDDHGGDATAGVTVAAEELGLDLLEQVEQVPDALGGDTSGAIAAVLAHQPDLVVLTVGPTEAAQIVGATAAQGFTGRYLLSHASFLPTLLDAPAGSALTDRATVTLPHESFGGDSDAHRAMQEALGQGVAPSNDGFTYGWMAAYPLRSVLQHAVDEGDLRRAAIRAVVNEVTVDYEGALPAKVYTGEPNETVLRSTVIAQPVGRPPWDSPRSRTASRGRWPPTMTSSRTAGRATERWRDRGRTAVALSARPTG